MGTAMNPPSMSEAKPAATRRRGRIQLLLILLGVIGPMVLATGMYKLQFWVPEGRSYHGELIGNGQTRADLGVQADEDRWQMLVTAPKDCAVDCQQLVYLARQIQIGLGRDAGRASHALAAAQPVSADYDAKLTANIHSCNAIRWTPLCSAKRRATKPRRNCGSSTRTATSCCVTSRM
jgi:hypothetical protein